MSNPFFDLQQRLADLLRANAYFADLSAEAVLTEKVGDIDAKIVNDLLPLGFGVAIKTAKGDGQSSLGFVTSRETIVVALINNPTLFPGKNVLDGLGAAMDAIVGKPVFAATQIRRENDCWQFSGHSRRDDAPPDLHVHELYVSAHIKLSGSPLTVNP
ncbi:hypothetical protein [Opitutus sp. ER46]|uniref:hypothetical protein n=1 Tax=Opitutus sp. ER46 TaxID=2161864 RepID=UPI000D326F79|nr:hypothetical protein [Opitutus sp. ER46]PTX95766.1 hypothetical protein DB354_10165 [Opitutus sp. ER46]